jgi:hypothetical protein
MGKTLLLFALAALSGGALAEQPPAAGIVEAAKAACVGALRSGLRDPDSLRVVRVTRDAAFEAIIAGRSTPIRAYEVVANAKNGFGGYTGNTSYVCFMDTAERSVLEVRPL